MSTHSQDHETSQADDQDATQDVDGEQGDSQGTVSEGGSSSLSAETALGGADSVPETPDVNDDMEDKQDLNVENDEPSDAPFE